MVRVTAQDRRGHEKGREAVGTGTPIRKLQRLVKLPQYRAPREDYYLYQIMLQSTVVLPRSSIKYDFS